MTNSFRFLKNPYNYHFLLLTFATFKLFLLSLHSISDHLHLEWVWVKKGNTVHLKSKFQRLKLILTFLSSVYLLFLSQHLFLLTMFTHSPCLLHIIFIFHVPKPEKTFHHEIKLCFTSLRNDVQCEKLNVGEQ